MDREPRPAPYPVGTRVRYIGTLTFLRSAEDHTPILTKGMEFVVTDTRPGHRGTLRQARDAEGPMFYDDTGEPILDETRDGYSVAGPPNCGRCIEPDAKDWELVASR